jgi:hypothetical protein
MKRIALFLLCATACGTDSRTELILGIASDLRATDQIDGVDLLVKRADDGKVVVDTHFTITGSVAMPDNLPGSYGIFSDGDETRLDITLTGTKTGAKMITRKSIINLVKGQTIFYRLGLALACMSKTDCPENQTCSEGQCVGIRLPATQFPEFKESFVNELTCNGTTNYLDSTTNQPMTHSSDAAMCPGSLCREGTCLTPPPSCSTSHAVSECNAAVAACNVGCMTTDCAFNAGTSGGNGCNSIESFPPTSECLAAVCALMECAQSPNAGWGGTNGCNPQGCQFETNTLAQACQQSTGGQFAPPSLWQ